MFCLLLYRRRGKYLGTPSNISLLPSEPTVLKAPTYQLEPAPVSPIAWPIKAMYVGLFPVIILLERLAILFSRLAISLRFGPEQ